ncbi:MAG: hypothetical protein JXA20_18210 [Spirochaetes bacterium]|nr:hypothetical protein [Spirochaetota bacterium]
MSRYSRLIAASVVLLGLALGFLGGIVADRWYIDRYFHTFMADRFIRNMNREGAGERDEEKERVHGEIDRLVRQRFIARMRERVGLREGQAERIGAILEERTGSLRSARAEFKKQIKGSIRETNDQIMTVLDARQRELFVRYFSSKMK